MNRLINVQKLVDVGFVASPPAKQLETFKKNMRLPDTKSFEITGNMRMMEKKDASGVLKLYNKQMEKCKVRQKMSQEEILHTMLPRDNLIWTYLVENEVNGKVQITDFWCLKRVTNVVLNKDLKHKDIKQAYLMFYSLTVNTYENMLKTQMHSAQDDMECDALSVLTLMDNEPRQLMQLNFHSGPQLFHYYMINWSLGGEYIHPSQLGLVFN